MQGEGHTQEIPRPFVRYVHRLAAADLAGRAGVYASPAVHLLEVRRREWPEAL